MGKTPISNGWEKCVDCDAIVAELETLRRESHEITLPAELRRANDGMCGDLRKWLTVHRNEQGHQPKPDAGV